MPPFVDKSRNLISFSNQMRNHKARALICCSMELADYKSRVLFSPYQGPLVTLYPKALFSKVLEDVITIFQEQRKGQPSTQYKMQG